MEKNPYQQLELFTRATEDGGIRALPRPNPVSRFLKGYERAVLVIIGLVISSIVAFSLGVEKGKRMQLIKIDSRLDIAQKRAGPPVPLKATPALKSQTRNPEWESKINPEEFLRESANYTVQVASYKNRQAAQKEIEILKKRGMKPLILYKGKYLVVCVGSFPDRKAAQSLLWELKKRYGDCIVRRL